MQLQTTPEAPVIRSFCPEPPRAEAKHEAPRAWLLPTRFLPAGRKLSGKVAP
jgi:hypothetical protein